MREHILSETVAKTNGILEHCMYCDDHFNQDDEWKIEKTWFTNYITVQCDSCSREHRFKDKNIHTIEDIIEKIQ